MTGASPQSNETLTERVGPSTKLANFMAALGWDDAPAHVRERVVDVVLDTIAAALAGRNADETPQLEAVGTALGGTQDSAVIGGPRLSMTGATFLNGYQVTAGMLCDIHRPTLCHVTPEVVPPALAVAGARRSSGRDFLVAVMAGLETAVRVGFGINYPAMRAKGWHSPGVFGQLGGGVAVGKVVGLDGTAMRNALALAGSQASGTFAHWGTPTIKFHQARGAVSGLVAGLLAEKGFLASSEILTHPQGGLLNTHSDGGDPDRIVNGLGDAWDLETISLRLWPTASSIQTVVTAVLALVNQHDLIPAQVESMTVRLSPNVYAMHGTIGWDREFEALLSARYIAAVVLHDRACWFGQFAPERLADVDLGDFARSRVVVESDQSVEGVGAAVSIQLKDGKLLEERRKYPHGDSADPLTRAEIIEKYRASSAMTSMSPAATESSLEMLIGLEELADVSQLCDSLSLTALNRKPVGVGSQANGEDL